MMPQNLCEPLNVPDFANEQDLKNWINSQASEHQLDYVLAHADDGIIWGHFRQGQLTASDSVSPQFPPLRSITLQQCRIFGVNGEVLLWRAGRVWKARFVGNRKSDIEEQQILWGTRGYEHKDQGFTVLEDGGQGLHHAVPLLGIKFDKDGKTRPIRLIVHHYITYDDDGLARITLSRLAGLTTDDSTQEN